MPVRSALAAAAAPPAFENEAERMASRLRLLHIVTAPSAEPFETRLQRALALTTTLLGLELGVLSRVDGDVFTVAAIYSTGPELVAGDTFPVGDTYCAMTLAHDDVFAVSHMGCSEHADRPCYGVFGLESYIGIPVRVMGETVGTLCFSGSRPTVPFTDADRDLLRVLAMWVGGAMEQQRQQRALTDHAAIVAGLYDASPLMMGVVELTDDGADIRHVSDNTATAALFGTTVEALRGRLASDSGSSKRVLALWIDAYRRADAAGAAVSFEYTDETPDGPLAVAATVARISPADPLTGQPARYCYVARDVTEQQQAQAALAASEARARALSRATFEGIAFSRDGVILDANDQFAAFIGLDHQDDAAGMDAMQIVTPGSQALVRRMISEGRSDAYEAELQRRDGTCFWADIQGQTVTYLDGREARVTAIRDVSRRRAAEQQIRFQADVLAHVSDAVVALDPDGYVTYWNAGAERLHGLSAETVLGRELHTVVRYAVPPPGGPTSAAVTARYACLALREAGGSDLVYEGPGGGRRVVAVSASPILGDDGQETGTLAVIRDVTAERELAAQMRHQALHDPLTGLPNRERFRQRVEAARRGGAPFAVLYVDLDHFKSVNDSLGHDAGDRLLLAVADRMTHAAGAEATVARLGGDEFGLVVPGNARTATATAKRLMRALRAPLALGRRDVVPSASVGAVTHAERYDDAEALLRDADTAMYDAKRAGRDRLSVFGPAMRAAVVERFALEHDLRRAVRDGEFCVRFQPILDLSTGQVAGVEALARWEHPVRGLLGPAQFVGLAEELGLIADIDSLILDATCREMQTWGDVGSLLTMVTVNCSDQSFLGAGLAARARAAADAAGIPPHCLTLELTERALVATDAATGVADAIRAAGLKLCVDDFGTGYSSLGLLHRLPVDGLKIDRSFVQDLATSPAAEAVVRAVVQFSADLGLRTVAEGIETQAQLARLRAMGCRYGQGFLFSPPVEPAIAREMLDSAPWTALWQGESGA